MTRVRGIAILSGTPYQKRTIKTHCAQIQHLLNPASLFIYTLLSKGLTKITDTEETEALNKGVGNPR